MSHSKRNTSRAVFTSYERSLAKAAWGANSARLTRDSFLPFASCSLCLESAIDPVSCPRGDIFCRECALENILAQKKEIKRADKEREMEEKEKEDSRKLEDEEARERAVREFELVQAGFDVVSRKGGQVAAASALGFTPGATTTVDLARRLEAKGTSSNGAKREDEQERAKKRKFSLDSEELARIAAEDRLKARKTLESEKNAKPLLPSFWSPTVTPQSNTKDVLHEVKKSIKTSPVCPASKPDDPHAYSLHLLVRVNFAVDEGGDGRATAAAAGEATTKGKAEEGRAVRICPACKKALSNSSRAMMAKPCGHVLCGHCVKQFMTPSGKVDPHDPGRDPWMVTCFVCDADVTGRKDDAAVAGRKEKKGKEGRQGKEKITPGLVELRSDGTGFSASGIHTVKKNTVAFQC